MGIRLTERELAHAVETVMSLHWAHLTLDRRTDLFRAANRLLQLSEGFSHVGGQIPDEEAMPFFDLMHQDSLHSYRVAFEHGSGWNFPPCERGWLVFP